MSCKEHDKITAKSLCLTQLLGRAVLPLNLISTEIDTETFKNILNLQEIAKNDTIELFNGLQTYNKYAKKTRETLIKELKNLNKI